MRVAIIHDYLNQFGGAERVLEVLHELFPAAPIFALVYDKRALPQYAGWDIRTSFLQKVPFVKQGYRNFVFLFPRAIASFKLRGYDLVISNTHAWGKGINLDGDTLHICYCLTPMRYIWDLYQDYIRYEHIPFPARWILPFWARRMRRWDRQSALKVAHFIAISRTVAKRIENYYQRDSVIIYPPCDTDFFKPDGSLDSGYYLAVSRLKSYKRMDILVGAFNKLGLPLKVAGEGPELKRLRQDANGNIEFTGRIADEKLLKAYQGCKALVFCGNEDFGLTMVEAQACGKPVIAYYRGGAKEIVIEGKTGMFFYEQTPQSLAQAIERFSGLRFDRSYIRESSLRFSKEKFKALFSDFIAKKLSAGQFPLPRDI